MDKLFVYHKKAKGNPRFDKIEAFISLVPTGRENAIKRVELVAKCVEKGLVSASSKEENQDRAMRNLLRRAKVDYAVSITNDGDGTGYYRPTQQDTIRLTRNNDRIDKHAISTFQGSKANKALAEDYIHERIESQNVNEGK